MKEPYIDKTVKTENDKASEVGNGIVSEALGEARRLSIKAWVKEGDDAKPTWFESENDAADAGDALQFRIWIQWQ